MTPRRLLLLAALAPLLGGTARADVVTDWYWSVGAMTVEARLSPAQANRVLAMVQTATYRATNAITGRYPAGPGAPAPAPGASVAAAVAAANRATLLKLLPGREAAVDGAYQAALATIAEGPEKARGIEVGEQAAAAVLAARLDDGAAAPEHYRPLASPGAYVPTTVPVGSRWGDRRPWLMTRPDQFRPGAPPDLKSALWARDYNEVKEMGARSSTRRSAEQTEVARFWEATMPPVYQGVVRSVADVPGREVTRNARLLMAVTQASDDALIAVFEAKYHYGFWRPITAIRNGDSDGNDATGRDPAWTPFIDTPMHPEYPCAHCIVSSALGEVLRAELGAGPVPPLTTSSPTAAGARRTWKSVDGFVGEVSEARICDGVHYRNSTEVGRAMGRKIGALAAATLAR